MSLKYLGTRHALHDIPQIPCAQLVNVPELQGTLRCLFCAHGTRRRTLAEYQACIQRHKCGQESLLFASLVNSMATSPVPVPAHFSPSPIISQLKVDNVKRYLQLWSCDLDGYECANRCHYYPQRLADEQSIADCSNSHACGRNGSWFDLLQIRDVLLFDLPDFYSIVTDLTTFYRADGTKIDSTLSDIDMSTSGLLQAVFANGLRLNILNMMPTSSGAGLLAYSDNRNWHCSCWYDTSYVPGRNDDQYVILTNRNHALANMLLEKGMLDVALRQYVGLVQYANTTDENRFYFAPYASAIDSYNLDDQYILRIVDLYSNDYAVVNLGNTINYLGYLYNSVGIKGVTRITLHNPLPGSFATVRITSVYDDLAQFFISLGARPTLFTSIS